jgi:hypothetical protein
VIGANNYYNPSVEGDRNDIKLWNPAMSEPYCGGNTSPRDGPITLADEQTQWLLWQQKLAKNGVRVGP